MIAPRIISVYSSLQASRIGKLAMLVSLIMGIESSIVKQDHTEGVCERWRYLLLFLSNSSLAVRSKSCFMSGDSAVLVLAQRNLESGVYRYIYRAPLSIALTDDYDHSGFISVKSPITDSSALALSSNVRALIYANTRYAISSCESASGV